MLWDWIKNLFKKEETDPMRYLIVGLGNMGAKYDGTRHNLGFEVVDHLAEKFDQKFTHENLGDMATFRHKGRTFILLKPSTYMNLSGKAVRYWMQKKKVLPENLLVIVDDLNLDYGTIRMKGKGSDGGHNGLKDIQQLIGTNYARIRVGIGDKFQKGRQVDYVLGKWSKGELEKLPEILTKVSDAALSFGTIGLGHTMSQFNG